MSCKEDIVKRVNQLIKLKSKNISIYSDIENRLADPQIKEIFSRMVFTEKDHKELLDQALSLLMGKF